VLDSLVADVRFALRWLMRSPAFTAVAVASLAIGIGFNTALFAVVDAVLLRPLPVARPDRIVDIYTSSTGGVGAQRFGTSSYPDYLDLSAQNKVFEEIAGYSPMFGALNLGDRSRLTLGEIVTGNYFRLLGVGASIGRTLLPEDDQPSSPRVAMISYRYWTREFGGDAAVAGRTLKLRGNLYTIVGVTPRGFNGMTSVLSPDLWVPISAAMEIEPVGMHDVLPSPTGTGRIDRRGDRWMFMKGRLKDGISVEQAGANLAVLMSRLESANPISNKDKGIAVKASSDVHFHPAADPVVVPIAIGLMLVVGLVLLIACANVASMLLARASGRQKEISVRLALGATRGRLMRQLVTESLVMSALGAAGGIVLALWATRVVASLNLPIPIPLSFDFRIDGRVLVFTMFATTLAGLLAGLIPAFRASRPSLVADLRGEIPQSRVAGRRWTLRDALVAGQMAITAVLLVVAALLTRSLIAAQNAAVGFPVDRLALVTVDTSMVQYSDEKSRQFFDQALARMATIPGVEAAALATRPPFSVNYNRWNIWIDGRHRVGEQGDPVEVTTVSPDYFKTMGVSIRQGRGFSSADHPDTPRVAVANETLARRFWPGESAVGKTFHTRGADGPVFTIVGVVSDYKVTTVGEPPTPFLHVAREQRPNSYSAIVVRTHGDANALLRDMQRELLALEPNLIFVENQTMEAEMATTLFPIRAGAWLVGVVGAMAMALAAIGLYGVIAYSVARRTREIGIRMALGAQPSAVLRLIMKQGLGVAAVGLVAGSLAAVAAAKVVSGALYGIGAADPVSWAGAAAVLLSVSALANLIPARRAARVEPSVALRVE
jgi:macrolide transport system ATP-binding/permease protein